MLRHCVICGVTFSAPPSSKKITCSPACSAKRKTASHLGVHNAWNNASRSKLSATKKAQGYSTSARTGLTAAMSLPESQRGPQHREAKHWVLIDPSGTRYDVVNLKDWARTHAEWFDIPQDDADRERIANNIRSGFGQIVLSMKGMREPPIYTYKNWRLGDWPKGKAK